MRILLLLSSLMLFLVSCGNASSKRSARMDIMEPKTYNTTEYREDKSVRNTTSDENESTESVISSSGTLNGHEWVDLGVSVLWGTCNVGALSPNEAGGFYAWGETQTKSFYELDNYFDKNFKNFDASEFMHEDGTSSIRGKTLIAPDSGYDTARENWGSSWRMPSLNEYLELRNKCDWQWVTSIKGNGYIVTGPNGNSIFFPMGNTGRGAGYWTNSIAGSSSEYAYGLFLTGAIRKEQKIDRYEGNCVRPVTDKCIALANSTYEENNDEEYDEDQEPKLVTYTESSNGHELADLGLSVKWATCNVGASSNSDYGNYYAWGETSKKSEYYWSNCFDCVNPNQVWDIGGWGIYNTQNKTTITPDSGHDTVRENWGGSWRMPTYEEAEELCTKCKWKWELINGCYGHVITGPNGNAIFLPATGFVDSEMEKYYVGSSGYYWTSSLSSSESHSARIFAFGESDHDIYVSYRRHGLSIRPVFDKDHQPKFPGGENALAQFIGKNLRYPAFAKENGIKGLVTLSFIVEKDGSISDIQVVRSPYEDLTREAERIVRLMPNWNPGIQNGIIERMRTSLTITFGNQ